MATKTESTSVLTEKELLDRIRALQPALRERASEAEKLRRLPDSTFEDVKATGYLSAFQPLYFGGSGLGLSALANGARLLAQACTSTGWTMAFLAQHTSLFAKANLQLQQDILGDDFPGMMAGAIGRTGTLKPVPGGYLLTARSDWNSGVMHAEWVNCKAMVEGDNTLMMVVLPVSDIVIDDVWHTAGLRGTGSNTIVAEDVFVPEYRVQTAATFLGTVADPVHDGDSFVHYPFIPVAMMTTTAAAIGTAEAAVDEFRALLERRTLAFSGNARQVEQATTQMRLGEAVAALHVVRLLWYQMLNKIIDTCDAYNELTIADRIQIRVSGAQVVHQARHIINDIIMPNAGGSSYFESAPLQRMQRDLEVLKGHALFDWDRVAQMAGRYELGIDPAPTDLL
jgi:3-hydroxy-9,10-secoandrosta-1,3,5(10)-triene-9,17-dione monooxygenase